MLVVQGLSKRDAMIIRLRNIDLNTIQIYLTCFTIMYFYFIINLS